MEIKRYFSKDYKFFWKTDSFIGNWYGVLLSRIGLKFLMLGRRMIRKGGGTFKGKYYSYCSWCGDIQDKNTGLHMSYGRKGARCGNTPKSCGNRPFV